MQTPLCRYGPISVDCNNRSIVVPVAIAKFRNDITYRFVVIFDHGGLRRVKERKIRDRRFFGYVMKESCVFALIFIVANF